MIKESTKQLIESFRLRRECVPRSAVTLRRQIVKDMRQHERSYGKQSSRDFQIGVLPYRRHIIAVGLETEYQRIIYGFPEGMNC
jgi:hypothetical protein